MHGLPTRSLPVRTKRQSQLRSAGTTQAEAINRRENETIDWRDIDIAATNWLAWKWYS